MNRKSYYFILCLVIMIGSFSCTEQNSSNKFNFSGRYFGEEPPDEHAKLFGIGIISTPLYCRDIAMMPNGDEVYFSVSAFGYNLIFFTKLINDVWTEPEPAAFITDFNNLYYEPHITYDGQKMFFLSNQMDADSIKNDQDIWVVNRVGGGWSKPKNLGEPINTNAGEFYPSTTKDGTLYFTRQEANSQLCFIYRSRLQNGNYLQPERLDSNVNCGANRYNAFVDVNEEFIIIPAAGMKDSFGGTDYYISFNLGNGKWSNPINMGENINSKDNREFSASLSPDGNYLFFMSARRNPEIDFSKNIPTFSKLVTLINNPQNGNSDIYWISTAVIDSLKLNSKI
jgi:hypothetical protein